MSATVVTIDSLTHIQCLQIIDELKSLDPRVELKVDHVMNGTGLTIQESLEYVVNDNPVLWAEVYLGWTARDYQQEILYQSKKSKKLVLRLGRRLGKTEDMVITILWHAFTQPNRDPNSAATDAYNILILTPFETQIDLIFDRLNQLIAGSPILTSELKRPIHHRIEFKNGAVIKGLTVGAKSGNEGSNTRGQAADLLIYDEVDYMGSKEITNTLNIANEDRGRIKIIAASTPSGKHEEFYRWCTDASVTYRPKQEDIENFRFTGYIQERNQCKGNGWVQIFAPSTVNKTLLDINPDTGQTYLEDIRDELSEIRYEQEVMAEFGEEEMGVYKKEFIYRALQLGIKYNHRYTNEMDENDLTAYLAKRRLGPLILGIDWDKQIA